MKLPIVLSGGLMTLVLLTGCASIVSGTRQKVNVASTPPGAKVTVSDWNGVTVATTNTPATIQLKRARGFFSGAEYKVRVEADSYQFTEVHLRSNMNGWYAGNILFGGLLGLVFIDPATGAMWSLYPKDLNVTLQPAPSAAATPSPAGRP